MSQPVRLLDSAVVQEVDSLKDLQPTFEERAWIDPIGIQLELLEKLAEQNKKRLEAIRLELHQAEQWQAPPKSPKFPRMEELRQECSQTFDLFSQALPSSKNLHQTLRKHPISKGKLKPLHRLTNGCITCRRRRVKCDETQPSCKKYYKQHIACKGYLKKRKGKSLRYVHQRQTSPPPPTSSSEKS